MQLVKVLRTVSLVGAVLAFPAAARVGAQTSSTVPSTAAEHLEMAKKYEAKAAEYKAEAETHRKMLADYVQRNRTPNLQSKLGKDPWIDKMKMHCEKYISGAESLAAEATAFADYHRMRGKELEGK